MLASPWLCTHAPLGRAWSGDKIRVGLEGVRLLCHFRQSLILLVETSTHGGPELVFGFIQNNGTRWTETSSLSSLGPEGNSSSLTSRTKATHSDTSPDMADCELAELCLTATLIFSPAGKRVLLVPAHGLQEGC